MFQSVATTIQLPCVGPQLPDGKLEKQGDAWTVHWAGETYRLREDASGYVALGVYTGSNGGYNGYVQYNPTTKEIFATDGYIGATAHLVGARADALIQHALATLFQR